MRQLPGSTFLEKTGTFTNAERRIQMVRKVMEPANGLEDWEVTQALANAMGLEWTYTTFHHPATQANVVTAEFSDWATNCPEYKVTAVQVMPSNGPTGWQEDYAELSERSRRIEAEPAE